MCVCAFVLSGTGNATEETGGVWRRRAGALPASALAIVHRYLLHHKQGLVGIEVQL